MDPYKTKIIKIRFMPGLEAFKLRKLRRELGDFLLKPFSVGGIRGLIGGIGVGEFFPNLGALLHGGLVNGLEVSAGGGGQYLSLPLYIVHERGVDIGSRSLRNS